MGTLSKAPETHVHLEITQISLPPARVSMMECRVSLLTRGYNSWRTEPPPTNRVLICRLKPTGSRLSFTEARAVHILCPYTVIQRLHDRQQVTRTCDQTRESNSSPPHRKPACRPLDHRGQHAGLRKRWLTQTSQGEECCCVSKFLQLCRLVRK